MTLIMAAKLPDRVVMVSDSLACMDDIVVPPFGSKIDIVGSYLIGVSGNLAYAQEYVRQATLLESSHDLFDPATQRKIQARLFALSHIEGVKGIDGTEEGYIPPLAAIIARGKCVVKATVDGLPFESDYFAVGSGDRVAYNHMYFEIRDTHRCAEDLVAALVAIGRKTAATDTSVGGPFFWADTSELAVWRYPE